MEPWREAEARPLWRRLAWMAAIWVVSVAALAALAGLLRLWIG
jgi:hypothetical protein